MHAFNLAPNVRFEATPNPTLLFDCYLPSNFTIPNYNPQFGGGGGGTSYIVRNSYWVDVGLTVNGNPDPYEIMRVVEKTPYPCTSVKRVFPTVRHPAASARTSVGLISSYLSPYNSNVVGPDSTEQDVMAHQLERKLGIIRHFFRVLSKPYHVASGETIGDYVDALVPELIRSHRNSEKIVGALAGLAYFVETLGKNNSRATLALAVEHWAARVSSPSSVRVIQSVFGVPENFVEFFQPFVNTRSPAARGLGMFQQALKDAAIIQGTTYLETLEQQGLTRLPPLAL